MTLLVLAPYFGILAGLVAVAVYLHLWKRTVPVAASGWRAARIGQGDCPVEHCGGKTYMVATQDAATLWRCVECKTAWLMSTIPGF